MRFNFNEEELSPSQRIDYKKTLAGIITVKINNAKV